MKKNMNSSDRIIRLLVAVGIIVLYFTNIIAGILSVVLLSLAALLMLTVFIGVCPLYSLFGISTLKKDKTYGTT
jgi:hypothetical protein